jgi:hypothetical protein
MSRTAASPAVRRDFDSRLEELESYFTIETLRHPA